MTCRAAVFLMMALSVLPVPVLFADDVGPLFNQVHIEAQAEQDVENDQLDVIMVVETQGGQPAEIASRINETMQWALQRAKKVPDIEASTRSYQTHPVYKDRLIVGWRASQELHLRSVNIARLTEMVGDLQERLQVRQMNFSPTPETRVKVENDLINEAMVAFRKRAEIIQAHMDHKNYRIVNLHVNTGRSGPPVLYQERAMSISKMADSSPAVEAGTSLVTVTVSGSVQYF